MWVFSFLSPRKVFDQKLLDLFQARWISEDAFIYFLRSYRIDNPYQIVRIDRDAFTFAPDGTAQDYFEYLAWRFELIQKYETISIEKMLGKKDTIFNPTIWWKKRIEDVCEFLIAEWIKNPLSYIADGHYLYHFFDTSKALDRVKEKYYFLKDCSIFQGKISDMMSFVLNTTYVTSLKRIQEEIYILEECQLTSISSRMWIVSDV